MTFRRHPTDYRSKSITTLTRIKPSWLCLRCFFPNIVCCLSGSDCFCEKIMILFSCFLMLDYGFVCVIPDSFLSGCKILGESRLHWYILAASFHVTHTFLCLCVSVVWVFVTQDATHFYLLTPIHFLTIHTSGVAERQRKRKNRERSFMWSSHMLLTGFLSCLYLRKFVPPSHYFVSIYCPISLLFYITVPFSVCFCLVLY